MLRHTHPCDPLQSDPVIIESQRRADQLIKAYCHRGEAAFEFKDDGGRHYVVTRANALRCMQFDRLLTYTSPHMIEALPRVWCHPGMA
ncbi:hypothetical protein [Bradyrhizobium sp. SZCCHNS3053]|uniref:hypothetical protein n=1 Tax=Bradyrhizobium sp. SZCCHNS3053 TaxID=3057322 RepID=UPI0029161890|nr:hypothetical protein [Bradyrhizobium sp. SZCCHNS3053]